MAIHKWHKSYIIEIQNGTRPEGILAMEQLSVDVRLDGGDPFLAIKAENLDPTDDYDEHTITLGTEEDIKQLADVLCGILKDAEEAYRPDRLANKR